MGHAQILSGAYTQRQCGHKEKKRLFCVFFGAWRPAFAVYIEVHERAGTS